MDRSWKLDEVFWAYMIAFKNPIGMFSTKLMFGKTFHLLIELEHKALWALQRLNVDSKDTSKLRVFQLHEMYEFSLKAYKSCTLYKDHIKGCHNVKILKREFKVGDVSCFSAQGISYFQLNSKQGGWVLQSCEIFS